MSSTQNNLPGKAAQTTTTPTTTTTTLTVPGTDTTIQVTGTKVSIPASFGRHHRHRQPTKSDEAAHSAPGATNPSPKPSTPSGTCPHYKWQPSANPSPSQTQTRYVPDCAKPRKGLIPAPAPKWCPVCSSGSVPPWAEAPKPTFKRKEGEKKKEVDEDEEAYDGRREDDWTDVWFDMD